MKKFITKLFLIISLLNLNNFIYSNTPESTTQEIQTKEEKEISESQTFTKEELKKRIQESLETIKEQSGTSGNKTISAKDAANVLSEKLSKFQITGFSTCFDPNFAFFFDWQNPGFEVMFKNEKGETKFRTFKSNIYSLGLKIELAFKFNLIFFINTDLTCFDTNKTIELGTGIDLTAILIDITYAPFKKFKGGLLILGFPLLPLFTGISIVTGGNLSPINI